MSSSTKKICLVNPPTTDPHSKDIYFPMALVCLGTVLIENGLPIEIVDFDLDLKKDPALKEWDAFLSHALARLQGADCRIFGISSICSNFPIALLLSREIKAKWPDAHIVLGGPQPSAVPEETLQSCPWVDAVAVGEGEGTILELAQTDWSKASLERIPGIVFLDNGRVKKTPNRALISNLDELPYPDFSLLPLRAYLNLNPGIALIEAGRGCPFLCSFCSTALMWERNFRVKSPGRIHQEMRSLSKGYGLRSFGLTHDNFTTSHGYVARFSEYFERNNKEEFVWSSSARPDTVNPERIEALHRAGCRGLFYGVDTGSDRIQKAIKKNLNLDHFRRVLSKSVSLGIAAISSFILGFHEETEDDINRTIELALEARLTGTASVQFHRLAPLASTEILRQHRGKLSLYSGPTDVSILPIRDTHIEALIDGDAALFSSFYSIETPFLGDLNVSALAVFYSALINHAAPVLSRLLKATRSTPTELFRSWMEWREENHPGSTVKESFILNTLGQFITGCLDTALPRRYDSAASIPVHGVESHG